MGLIIIEIRLSLHFYQGWVAMNRVKYGYFFFTLSWLWTPPLWAISAERATPLSPGLTQWLVDLYNNNLWIYALVVVGIMAVMGFFLGFLFDWFISLLGIHLGKIEHKE